MKLTTLCLSVAAMLASAVIACSSGTPPPPAAPEAKAPAVAATTAASPAATAATSATVATTAASGATGAPSTTVAATPLATAPPAPSSIEVIAVEDGEKYRYEPATFTVKAGEVTVKFTNKTGNRREHTFIVPNPTGGPDLAGSADLRPGRTVEVKFTVSAAGQYRFLCAVEGHEDRGQTGMMTVTRG